MQAGRGGDRIHMDDEDAASGLAHCILRAVMQVAPEASGFATMCVGTDRLSGDSFGPFVGMFLESARIGFPVVGTLEDPVHAANIGPRHEALRAQIKDLPEPHRNIPILVVDAALGSMTEVGKMHVAPEPAAPGAGVGKTCPIVGDFYLQGTVNVWTPDLAYFTLMNTRLHHVYAMAKITSQAIAAAIYSLRTSSNEAAAARQ